MGLERWLWFLNRVEESGAEAAVGGVEECSVCLSRLEKKGEEVKVLPCSHQFHKQCVERWLEEYCRRTCPLCRFCLAGDYCGFAKSQVLLHTDDLLLWFSSFHI